MPLKNSIFVLGIRVNVYTLLKSNCHYFLCEENEKWSNVHLSNIDCVINLAMWRSMTKMTNPMETSLEPFLHAEGPLWYPNNVESIQYQAWLAIHSYPLTCCSPSLLGHGLIITHYMYNNIKMFLSLVVFRYFAFVLAQINMSLECGCQIKYWPLKWQDLDGWSSN